MCFSLSSIKSRPHSENSQTLCNAPLTTCKINTDFVLCKRAQHNYLQHGAVDHNTPCITEAGKNQSPQHCSHTVTEAAAVLKSTIHDIVRGLGVSLW